MQGLKLRLCTLFNLFFLCFLSADLPTQAELDTFYEGIVLQGRATLPGIAPLGNETEDLQRFTNQNFMLWDYLIGIGTEAEYQSHFDNLMTLCQNRKIGRLILFIKDPSANNFFQPNNATGFVARANQLFNAMVPIVPSFDIAVFFSSVAFSSTAPAGMTPTVNPAPDTILSGYFTDIQNMLDWAKAIIGQVPGVKEITFDPEAPGANKTTQQYVYNYTDEYKWLNALGSIRLGTTLGVDESKVTYANLSTFPVNPIYTASIGTNPPFPSPMPTWARGSDVTAPLLQSVYIQCYESAIPAMFEAGFSSSTGAHSGSVASNYFNSMLRDLPYLQGVGTISFMQGSTAVTGMGTNFTSFSDPLLFSFDSAISANNKIGAVCGFSSATSLSLEGGAAFSSMGFQSFTRTEIITAWSTTQPVLTQAMLDNIYWMFSANYEPSKSEAFFGNWQLGDFMDFIDGTVGFNEANTTNPFTLNGDGSTYLQVPTLNYVLYDYYFGTTTVNTTPKTFGVTDPWDLLSN